MPTYDYVCDNCGNEFEKFQSMKDEPLKVCEKCGESSLRRLIGGGAGLIFKGSGFYLTDYKNKPSESKTAEKKTEKTSETKTPAGKTTEAAASKKETKPAASNKKE